jgi:hypothetical protein
MATSNLVSNDNSNEQPIATDYPTAPTILPTTTSNTLPSSASLQLDIRENVSIDNHLCTTLSFSNDIYYYFQYQQPQLQQQQQQQKKQEFQEQLLLLNKVKQPLWKLTNQDWHGITIQHLQQTAVVLSTTPPQFRFSSNNQMYHWQLTAAVTFYTLTCYQTDTKSVISELHQDQFKIYHHTTNNNPFRIIIDDPLTTLIISTGLLVRQHINTLLKSLGGNIQMIIHWNTTSFNDDVDDDDDDDDDEYGDDIASLSSTYPKHHYPGHQSLVDSNNTRWSSSAQSFKSIELAPGVWHCWWGYTCWWSWFPCCMPGGLCDRACIRIKGHNRKTSTTTTTRTLSKQGWQQQHY